MAEHRAAVVWEGGLTDGGGEVVESGSGALPELPVTWHARAEGGTSQTSPEELIAAAHAACFSMALSGALAERGTPPERLETGAVATFVPGEGITGIRLSVSGRVPGVEADAFREAAEQAKDNCPVSQALRGNVEMSVTARLAS